MMPVVAIAARGRLTWKAPTLSAVVRVLTNPAYAGAYVYGRWGYAGARRSATTGKLAARHRNVKAVPEALLMVEDELKNQMEEAIKEASGAKLTAAERKEFNRVSLDYLWRMARNEIQGYDVRPALTGVLTALRSPETAPEALEILSRLPGSEPQSA